MTRLLTLIITLILVSACDSKPAAESSVNGRISPIYQGPAEQAYCSTPITYGDTVTVSGTAKFRRRNSWGDDSVGGLGSAQTTGTHPATEHPIRRAEIRVTNSSGTLVQCGETGEDGTFSLSLPRGAASYTISINSRSSNSSYLRASVLDRPERNRFYSLQESVIASTSTSGLQMMAAADGDVLGGAFNILDQFYEANKYIRSKVPTFTSAPKVAAYWEKGFNPNTYFGSDDPISFYLPGYDRLFLMGGLDGDVDNSDTDHFDNSVILHEYGHFLEDHYFESDSPGGSHNGNKIIDPRLAWSEGFGNFFQAAILYDAASTPYYIDSIGNDDGITELIYHTNLEGPPLYPNTGTDCYPIGANSWNGDCPRVLGEGNFREFSIARMLWDMVDSVTDNRFSSSETVIDKFSEFWAVMTATSNGFNDSKFAFKNVGLFHLSHDFLPATSSTNLSGVRGVERHKGDTSDYADYVTPSGTCTMSITASGSAQGVVGDTGSFATSDLLRNNDFYHLVTATTLELKLEYVLGSSKVDLDLFAYNESAQLGVLEDMRGLSRTAAVLNATNTETITLPPGTHLINVMVQTGSGKSTLGTTVNYELKLGGTKLCPSTLVQ